MKRVRKAKAPAPPLERAVMAAVQAYLRYRSDVVVFRQNTGAAQLKGRGGKMRPVFFGVRGQADFSGLISPWGVRVEIEVKRPELGVQSDAQRVFEAKIKAAGGVYILARSADELRVELDIAIAGLRERFGLSAKATEATT